VYGPQGCGKTRYAERIRKHFGLDSIVDEFDPRGYINPTGELYLVNCDGPAGSGVVRCMSFAEVAQQINDAIPLTDWQSGPPPAVGEWNSSYNGGFCAKRSDKRWWNGEYWSCIYFDDDPQDAKNDCAGIKSTHDDESRFVWRGLAEEPIVVAA
jgi:hypothetical protein